MGTGARVKLIASPTTTTTLLVFVVVVALVGAGGCASSSYDISHHLGTKTPYRHPSSPSPRIPEAHLLMLPEAAAAATTTTGTPMHEEVVVGDGGQPGARTGAGAGAGAGGAGAATTSTATAHTHQPRTVPDTEGGGSRSRAEEEEEEEAVVVVQEGKGGSWWRPEDNDGTVELIGGGRCTLVNIQTIARHGSRYPTGPTIKRFSLLEETLIPLLKDSALPDSLKWIKDWTSPYTMALAGALSGIGQRELFAVGQRFSQRFPLLRDYNPNTHPMQCTHKPRTSQSATAFGAGLFHTGCEPSSDCQFIPFSILSESASLDYTLRFFSLCDAYQTQVHKNASTFNEANLYAQSNLPTIQDKITQKLGLGTRISEKEVDTIWSACQFDVAVQGTSDKWCSLFDEEDVTILEYIEDLESYWERGYGHKINYHCAAPLLQEIYKIMDATVNHDVNSKYYYTAKSRFAHAETMLPLYALLGLFQDPEPLTAATDPTAIRNRKWRDSIIGTFCTNVAFLLYNCTTPPAHQSAVSNYSFAVKLLFNEKEIAFPGCEYEFESTGMCPFTKFKQNYLEALSIDFDEICNLTTSQMESLISSDTAIAVEDQGDLAVDLEGWGGQVVPPHDDRNKVEIGQGHLFAPQPSDNTEEEDKKREKKEKKRLKKEKKEKKAKKNNKEKL
ncbi:histidine acid phosphatase superfamily protein [Pelomyxa schiedti]|nr:histidine acid phosphatase superfamily protein [Pelomyxa schiedti]